MTIPRIGREGGHSRPEMCVWKGWSPGGLHLGTAVSQKGWSPSRPPILMILSLLVCSPLSPPHQDPAPCLGQNCRQSSERLSQIRLCLGPRIKALPLQRGPHLSHRPLSYPPRLPKSQQKTFTFFGQTGWWHIIIIYLKLITCKPFAWNQLRKLLKKNKILCLV